MKRFFNLVITNMANALKPIIILAVITVAVQVILYSFSLFAREDYKDNTNLMIMAEEENIICEKPINFMDESYVRLFIFVTNITVIVSIMLVKNNSREKDAKLSMLRLLPVKRSILFRAKATANTILIVGIYIINVACLGISYMVYNTVVHEKFREARIERVDDFFTVIMLVELIVCVISAIILSAIDSKKAYSVYSE